MLFVLKIFIQILVLHSPFGVSFDHLSVQWIFITAFNLNFPFTTASMVALFTLFTTFYDNDPNYDNL